jgi:type VI secretion system protein ImpE
MTALDALRNVDLSRALELLKDEVRREPQVAKHRIFLFQLLAILGQWDRALTQLNVARDMDPEAKPMAQTYQEMLTCEVLRSRVFAGERSPLLFGEPEPWMAQMLEAQRLTAQGQWAQAQDLRGRALEEAPAVPGQITPRQQDESAEEPTTIAFEWIADADSRLGPLLEAVVNGRYYWVPFQRIAVVDLEPPADLRDLVWLPAHFQWTNGGETVGFVPTRYPDSEAATDDFLRMARKTQWLEREAETFLGIGQRLLTTDGGDYGLTEIIKIQMAR